MTIDEQIKDMRHAYELIIATADRERRWQLETIRGTTMPAGEKRAIRCQQFAKAYEGIIATLQVDRERKIKALEKKRK